MSRCSPVTTLAETRLVLEKDGNEEAIDSTQFGQMVGSLRYLCNTRPDNAYSVGFISS